MRIAGLDLSLNGSGCVIADLNPNTFEIISYNYLSFTTIKKLSSDKIYYHKKDHFRNRYLKYNWMIDKILKFINFSEHIAIEGYSYASKGNSIFDIAEFSGIIKFKLLDYSYKLRIHDPSSIKMFATGKGNADKMVMQEAYILGTSNPLGLPDKIPLLKKKNESNPRADIVDAYYIMKLLHTELQLRNGIITIQNLSVKHLEIFNRVTKAYPVNILSTPFISWEEE